MVVLTELLEGPVSAVGNVGLEAVVALVDDSRIKHHAHCDTSEDRADHNHNG